MKPTTIRSLLAVRSFSKKTFPAAKTGENHSVSQGPGLSFKHLLVIILLTAGVFTQKANAQTVPDAPTGLSAAAGVGRALLTFTAPANNGGASITNYEYSTDNGTTWTAVSPASAAPSILISGLTNCTAYNVKIRAVNSAGAGTATSAVSVTPRTGALNTGWIIRSSAANNNWQSVTYGNGLFVAVASTGTGNRVMTSPDGITWTVRSSAADNQWSSVAYGNGLFVAVAATGTGNRVMTSPDGITWTIRTSAADNSWQSVTYGNGLFVAVANSGWNNLVMTSPDGITWTIRSSAENNNWYGVTYGNGLFVAVAGSGTGNRVMTSTNGITWTIRTSAADNNWQSITYGNGLFVAVATSGTGNRVMTSPDGITWTIRSSAADYSWYGVTYGNGLFVAVAATGTGNRAMTSPDGINWTLRNPSSYNNWRCVTHGNGLFVAVANSGWNNRVMTSWDLIVPDKPAINSITGGNYISVAYTAGAMGGSAIRNYEYSLNGGSNWVTPSPASTSNPFIITGVTPSTAYQVQLRAVNSEGSGCVSAMVNTTTTVVTAPDAPTGLAATAGIGRALVSFTAPANDGGGLITNYEYSTDNGASWTAVSPASTATSILINGLTNNCAAYNLKIRALNSGGAGTASPAVSVTPRSGTQNTGWTIRTAAAFNEWNSVTYGNGLFVAVASGMMGTGNRVMTSPDGITWTIRSSAADNQWTSVTYGNGLFVAVAFNGTGNRVMTSPDGITWTARSSAADNQWTSVTYGNGLFVAVAGSGPSDQVMTSPDGINWTIRSSAVNNYNYWTSVTYGNGLFVAVAQTGTGNRVMTSPDGITWTERSSAADNQWSSVTYGNGLFVAVSFDGTGNRVMTSPDGITWTIRSSAADNDWYGVTYGNGLFVAVATSGWNNRVMTSPDGITWTSRTSAENSIWLSVTYGNGQFVAVANSGSIRVMTSWDLIVPEKPVINNITPGGDSISVAFTAPSDTGGSAISNYEYSLDNGTTWTARTPASTISPLTISGLTPSTAYQVQLRAVNTTGSGCVSATVNTQTLSSCTPTPQPTIACYETATWNTTTCQWDVAGTQPSQPSIACYETATFNGTTCQWDVTGTQPSQPTLACYQTATFNGTTCQWDVTGTQPAQPTLACYQTATFNGTTCQWDVTGTQPSQPSIACYETATFNGTTCQWDVTGTQPSQPSIACYETATFNGTTCQWDVTGTAAAPIVTTESVCDSYTWAQNGQTYTASGTYSSNSNCQDYVLNLTVSTTVTYYADSDGDGYGSNTVSSSNCTGVAPAGYISTSGDCNDNNASVKPGTAELCNSIDDDCDGVVDDNPLPVVTGSISGTSLSCRARLAGNATFTLVGATPGATSVWSVPAGFSITSGQGTPSITVSYTASAIDTGISAPLCMNISDACGSSAFVCTTIDYQIAAPVTPPSISGPTKPCPGDVATFSFAAVARATSYTWTMPAGATLLSGQGSNIVQVNIGAGFTGGNISVIAANACGYSNPRTRNLVNAGGPPTPTAISGTKFGLCNSTGVVYTANAVIGAISYLWSVTGGGVIVSGQGTGSITVDYPSFTAGNITVQAANSCGASQLRTLYVTGAPGKPEAITGAAPVCRNATEAYSIPTVNGTANNGYNWTVTSAGTITSGQGTKSISVLWHTAASLQALQVNASNACGTGPNSSRGNITVSSCSREDLSAAGMDMEVYPNPAQDRTHVVFNTNSEDTYRLNLTDMSGRTILSETGTTATGRNEFDVYFGDVQAGVYFIEIRTGEAYARMRIVIAD